MSPMLIFIYEYGCTNEHWIELSEFFSYIQIVKQKFIKFHFTVMHNGKCTAIPYEFEILLHVTNLWIVDKSFSYILHDNGSVYRERSEIQRMCMRKPLFSWSENKNQFVFSWINVNNDGKFHKTKVIQHELSTACTRTYNCCRVSSSIKTENVHPASSKRYRIKIENGKNIDAALIKIIPSTIYAVFIAQRDTACLVTLLRSRTSRWHY